MPRPRLSVKAFETGALTGALTSGWTTSPGCSIPSFGVGSTTMVATTSRRFTRRYAI
jgi:hypothetical protein